MTSYTVKFTGTRTEQLTQALAATTDYLGQERLDKIRTAILAETQDCKSIIRFCRLACMLQGVQGYLPVHAFTLYVLAGRN